MTTITEEPIATRVLRQVHAKKLDETRLLPNPEKRMRDVVKKLDRLAGHQGWYTFVAAQAYAIKTGKAPSRRNAEVMLVTEVTRWRDEVERYADNRLGEFENLIHHAIENPAPVQKNS